MELICRGIERDWLYDHRVAVYTVKSLRPASLVEWSRAIADSLDQSPKDTDYIAIHDMSNSGMSMQLLLLTGNYILDPWLTSNSQLRFREWMKLHPAQRVRLAVVLSSALSGQIPTRRGRSSTTDNEQVESQMFDNLEAAHEWVNSLLYNTQE
ncbi:MAG: hypothetical protein SF123_05445 [Chloroflexota bacterium]|nr:hypothetical protein [Chloroflexota bacterium]